LHEGETVRFIAQGTYENDQGVLVLTDVRLLFLFHGVMRQRKEDFPLRLISSVQTKSALGGGEIKVFVSGNSASISGIIKSDLEPLADAVRQGMAAQHAAPPNAPPAASADDPYEALRKLASLRDAGVLTEAEGGVQDPV
jgi:Bacterial PH domain